MRLELDMELIGRGAAVFAFVLLTAVGAIFSFYLIFSINQAYMYPIAISFLILTIISGFFNVFTSYSYYRSYLYNSYLERIRKGLKPLTRYPTVAIAMPVYNEDTAVVERNLLQLKKMNYPQDKLTFYLLDDSTDAKKRKELLEFCKSNMVHYMRREKRSGFKAGALNNMLKKLDSEFLAIFDYDEYLTNNNFLHELLPYFDDSELSYIQTEKRYFKGNFFSDTIDLFDALFFKFIQPARALNNTAIFAGSCGIIRSSYLKKLGGFPEYIIEDTFFSFESGLKGYKSLYVPKVYALGKPVQTFSELAKQQWRYNYGDTQFLFYLLKKLRGNNKSKKSMSTLSRIDYMTHGFGLNYISTIMLIFTIVSILIVFSQVSLLNVSLSSIMHGKNINFGLEVLGILAFLFSILTPIILTKLYFKSIKKGLMIFVLNFSLVFIRTRAAIAAAFNLKRTSNKLWASTSISRVRYQKVAFALRNSLYEVFFSALLLSLGYIALGVDNFVGGVWLLWYGLLYISTLFLFYKYG
jgi:cellulose synthase/poly-beta-1,6-N-acetylglucosamine synthase-like glycosyltransferase